MEKTSELTRTKFCTVTGIFDVSDKANFWWRLDTGFAGS